MNGQAIATLDDDQIGNLLSRDGLCVVLMTASWDGNGIIFRSLIEMLSDQYTKVFFSEADFETTPRLAKLFNMTRPPGLLFVKDGELVHRISGPTSAGAIGAIINEFA